MDSLAPWVKELGVTCIAASDFWPHGEVARQYGVLNRFGVADRAIFLIDREGRIRFKGLYAEDEIPPVAPVLEALRQLSKEQKAA